MTKDEAKEKMRAINDQISALSDAYQRLNLIASGAIESTEEITIQAKKAQDCIDSAGADITKIVTVAPVKSR